MYVKQTLDNLFWTATFLNELFIILFCSEIFKVSIWPMYCSLGNKTPSVAATEYDNS